MGYKKHFFTVCPIIKKKINFYVEYESFNFASNIVTRSTKVGYDCRCISECRIEDSANCPLFRKAPESV